MSRLNSHVFRTFIKVWHKKRHQVVENCVPEQLYKEVGLKIYQPTDLLSDKIVIIDDTPKKELWMNLRPRLVIPPPDPLPDTSHPLWQDRVCHIYDDTVDLIDGMLQAKTLTKTVEVQEGLPQGLKDYAEQVEVTDNEEQQIISSIFTARMFDATQLKLKDKNIHADADKSHWNLPREYGIPLPKRNVRAVKQMLSLCERKWFQSTPASQYSLLDSCNISLPMEKDGDLVLFNVEIPLLVSSRFPLEPFADHGVVGSTEGIALPDIFPVKPIVDFVQSNTYKCDDDFTLNMGYSKPYPHTALILYNFDPTTIHHKLISSQLSAMALVRTFTIAAAHAKQRFGSNVVDLAEPVTIQCILSNGRDFQFGVFQLNTLDLDGINGKRNIYWMSPTEQLYKCCEYVNGVPRLTEFNPNVFRNIVALYRNGLREDIELDQVEDGSESGESKASVIVGGS